jgi:hypothetical protein
MATGNFARCGSKKGRERALIHLHRIFESAGARFVDRDERRARWAFLRPMGDMIIPALITVDQENCGMHGWLIAFTDHALQRAIQRGVPGLDLTELCWHAIDSARRLSVRFLISQTTLDRFRVAAGEGAFACEMHLLAPDGNEMPAIRAATWLSSDQMSAVQEGEVVVAGHPGERFDDCLHGIPERLGSAAGRSVSLRGLGCA